MNPTEIEVNDQVIVINPQATTYSMYGVVLRIRQASIVRKYVLVQLSNGDKVEYHIDSLSLTRKAATVTKQKEEPPVTNRVPVIVAYTDIDTTKISGEEIKKMVADCDIATKLYMSEKSETLTTEIKEELKKILSDWKHVFVISANGVVIEARDAEIQFSPVV